MSTRGLTQQLVEMFVNDSAEQVLAIIGNFRILVYDQYSAGLGDASADRSPVVRKNAAQIDNVATQALLLQKLICCLHAHRQLVQRP